MAKKHLRKVAEAMINHACTRAIELEINKHGPLFVQAVCETNPGTDPFYSLFFVAHADEHRLDPATLRDYYRDFASRKDGMETTFDEFLDNKGYIVLTTAYDGRILRLDTTR